MKAGHSAFTKPVSTSYVKFNTGEGLKTYMQNMENQMKPATLAPTSKPKSSSKRKRKPFKSGNKGNQSSQKRNNKSKSNQRRRSQGNPPQYKRSGTPQRPPFPTDEPTSMEPDAFAQLGLGTWSLAAVRRVGYETPTEIQKKFIPAALSGRDCVGQAKTGTGKTAAFLLPFFEQFFKVKGKEYRTLILAPTRELALQISDEAKKLAGPTLPEVLPVYGGKPIQQQMRKLDNQPDIVVATPGRLLDLSRRGAIDLKDYSTVILDEVDHMFDIGFRKDITTIMRQCRNRTQTMFLSATMPQDIMRFADQFLKNPIRVSAVPDNDMSVETLDQRYFAVADGKKLSLLTEVIHREKPTLGLIFTRTKRGAESLGKTLQKRGYQAMYIHGGLTQSRRQKALKQFRDGKIKILVATDVVGRGIDVPGVSHVINYDIPENPKDYLHRIGRSGRMNAPGKAFTFVTPSQGEEIMAIEDLSGRLLERDQIEGFDNGAKRRR